MRRIHQALTTLVLGLALVTATIAAAAAMPPTGTEDPHDQATRKELYQSELERNLLLRNQHGQQSLAAPGLVAQRKALYTSELERNRARDRALGDIAAQPAAGTDPATPRPGVDVLVTLLVGLVGGLLGGAAVMVGWTATRRRRLHRPAAGT
jgi:hypothetical protein